MESRTKKRRAKHTDEFKREAVRLLESRGDRTITDVAASLGVAENLLHAWRRKLGLVVKQVRHSPGGETPEAERKRLRRELTQVKRERDVLKKRLPASHGTAHEPIRSHRDGEGQLPHQGPLDR